MPRYILHHEGWFFEWSTVVDAAVTPAMTPAEFTSYYRNYYGLRDMAELPARLERAVRVGTSSKVPGHESARSVVANNRMGESGQSLSFDDVISAIISAREEELVLFDPSKKVWVHCDPCDRTWSACDLPMPLDTAAKVVADAHCPGCGQGSAGLFMATQVQVDAAVAEAQAKL